MNQSEMYRYVKQIIRQELAPIMMASITKTQDVKRASGRRFAGESEINNMRLIFPYGFASRPKSGTDCVAAPIGNDPTHLNIVGQFDSERPSLDDGESILYGPEGQVIFMKSGGTIHQGTKTADEPVVLGNVLKEFLEAFIDELTTSPQIGIDSFGLPVFLDPTVLANLLAQKLQYLTTASTNIVAQKNFVERGV